MKNINHKRVLVISCSVILLCMAVVIGATWALFSDTEAVQTHLQAGTLDITLQRVELTKTVIDSLGYLETDKVIQKPTDPTVDFTDTTTFTSDKNVFDIQEGEVIVPGSKYTATLRIENHGSVACGYWIEIVCSDPELAGALADQVIVSVNDGDGQKIGEGLAVGSDQSFIAVLDANKDQSPVSDRNSDTFTVTIEFVDELYGYDPITGELASENDAAQGKSLEFDLVVHAVQVTGKQ